MTMRWPWVSRARYDDVVNGVTARLHHAWDHRDKEFAELHKRHAVAMERERVRYDTLLSRYQQLRLQGFSEPTAPVARPVVAPDPIKRAIAQRAGTNRPLREAMERQVAQDRLLGKSDEEILSAIIAGVSGEDLILSEAGLMSP